MDKRDFFFRNIPEYLRYQIQLDDVAMYSVTENITADKMTRYLCDRPDLVILDGMACIGGNTFSFAKSSNVLRVISNELNSTRFQMLENNIAKLSDYFNFCPVKTTNINILEHPDLCNVDVLFLDPEWGGPDYYVQEKLRLPVSDVPLETFVQRVFDTCPRVSVIGVKLPCNYDPDALKLITRVKLQIMYSRKMILAKFTKVN